MSVWFAVPSKRPPEQAESVLKLWRERGYKIALWLDQQDIRSGRNRESYDFGLSDSRYPGYAIAVNRLIERIVAPEIDGDDNEFYDPSAEWIVTGGDDVEPDPNHSAEEIAAQCRNHFDSEWVRNIPTGRFFNGDQRISLEEIDKLQDQSNIRVDFIKLDTHEQLCTFGVMQPTGDRWGEAQGSAYIDRVCGSPWLGREFCRRIYGGKGPFFPGYTHMGVDEELQAVAEKLGVLWQRRDLTHYHRHWGRPKPGERMGDAANMPEFLKEANSPEHWRAYKKLFAERKAAGFPGYEPI